MRKIIAATFVSLDGVMQAPGGPEEDPAGGFRLGGWTVPYWDDAIGAVLGEGFAAGFDLLLGRRTYDIFAAHWPHVDVDPSSGTFDALNAGIANTFNGCTKYVATRSPETLDWQNSRWLGADVVAGVREIRDGDGPNLLIQGSSVLIRQLLAAGLIDTVQLLIYPVVLGKGKRLFGDDAMPAAFTLAKSATSPGGVLMATYERAGPVRTGSFAMENPTDAELARRAGLGA